MIRFLIAILFCSWIVPTLAAPENLKRVEGVYLDKVAVVNGELKAGKERGSGWLFRKTPRGTLIYLAGGERAGAWNGWYLNYDHKGKDSRVGLVPEPGPGCYWTWSEGAWKKNPGGFGYTFPCSARPMNGPLRGRSLSVDGTNLVLTDNPLNEIHFKGTIDDLNDGK
jgi:hypothetical protein